MSLIDEELNRKRQSQTPGESERVWLRERLDRAVEKFVEDHASPQLVFVQSIPADGVVYQARTFLTVSLRTGPNDTIILLRLEFVAVRKRDVLGRSLDLAEVSTFVTLPTTWPHGQTPASYLSDHILRYEERLAEEARREQLQRIVESREQQRRTNSSLRGFEVE